MAYHIGILPDDVLQAMVAKVNTGGDFESPSQCLRFVRMPHPRTGIPSLFLPFQTSKESAILEIQSVSPPNPRSWFVSTDDVVEDGKLLLMTPVDPAFLLMPILQHSRPTHADGYTSIFRTMEDLFEEAAAKVAQESTADHTEDSAAGCSAEDTLHLLNFRFAESALRHICEAKEITPDVTVYRYCPNKVQEYLRTKVKRLARPEVSEGSKTLTRNLVKDGLMDDGNESLLESGRVRAACNLLSQYISPDVYNTLLASYDFVALDGHLTRQQEDFAALAAADMNKVEKKESKGKSDFNKKRKAPKASHGVEKLKKANVKGMATISSFFQKPSK